MEYADFYTAAARIVQYWKGKLFVDGEEVGLPEFMSELDGLRDFNRKCIKQFSQDVLDGQHDTLTIYSALFPPEIGRGEAARFVENPDDFPLWLHERQSIDASFASAKYYINQANGYIHADYQLYAGCSYILPGDTPNVPFGMYDPNTGRELECKDYRVMLCIDGVDTPIASVPYSEFYGKLPADKLSPFDGKRMLLSPLTADEIRSLY